MVTLVSCRVGQVEVAKASRLLSFPRYSSALADTNQVIMGLIEGDTKANTFSRGLLVSGLGRRWRR